MRIKITPLFFLFLFSFYNAVAQYYNIQFEEQRVSFDFEYHSIDGLLPISKRETNNTEFIGSILIPYEEVSGLTFFNRYPALSKHSFQNFKTNSFHSLTEATIILSILLNSKILMSDYSKRGTNISPNNRCSNII